MIKVQSVSTRETTAEKWKEIEFTVKAEVQKVERSATKLASGATIEIRYSQRHYSQPIAGPSEVPALKEGRSVRPICPEMGKRIRRRPAGIRSRRFGLSVSSESPSPVACWLIQVFPRSWLFSFRGRSPTAAHRIGVFRPPKVVPSQTYTQPCLLAIVSESARSLESVKRRF